MSALLEIENVELDEYQRSQVEELSARAQTENAAWVTLGTCLCVIESSRNSSQRRMFAEIYNRVLERFGAIEFA